nr:DoxX family protein [uncultured Psychroserpens sp.]
MKLLKIKDYLNHKNNIGILLLRIFIGCRLIYGVIDNIISWGKMLEFASFLESHQFPFPIVSAVLSVGIQFVCGLFVLIGYKIRIASFFLVINFVIALLFVHIKSNDSLEGMTPALAMLFGSLTFIFTGADEISLDHYTTRTKD